MSMICTECGKGVRHEKADQHFVACRIVPLFPASNAELEQQHLVAEQHIQEFTNLCRNEENPYFYKNMNLGGNILADLPCNGCSSFQDHMKGYCIGKRSVENYKAAAFYLKNKALHEYKKLMDLALQNSSSLADLIHAKGLKLSPDLTPELITSQRASRLTDAKYKESMMFIKYAATVRKGETKRFASMLEKQNELMCTLFETSVELVKQENKGYIVKKVKEGKLDRSLLDKINE